eukprot:28021-Eustigmatos_ZCMA.PRE.1
MDQADEVRPCATQSVIEELDVKKNQALEATWVKVCDAFMTAGRQESVRCSHLFASCCLQINRDFGSIFSTLLPGTQAKLEP